MNFRKIRDTLLPLTGYLVLAAVYLLPLPLHWGTAIPGDNGDAATNFWSFWYFPWQLSQGHLSFHSVYQFAPDGIDLIYASTSVLGAVLMSPIAWLWSPAAALNTWLALHLWLGGWFFYKFCRTLEISVWGGWLAGCAYAWSPFVAVHIPGHYTLVQIAYSSGAMWALAELAKRCATRKYHYCPAIACGLAVAVWSVAVTDFYLSVMTLFLLIALLIHVVIRYGSAVWNTPRFYTYLVSAAGLTMLGLLPWINEMMEIRELHEYAVLDTELGSRNVATWSRLVTLSAYHPIFGPHMYPEYEGNLSALTEYTYMGMVALATAFIGVLYVRNWRRIAVWIVAFVIALGLSGQNSYSPVPSWSGPLSFGKYWPQFFPFSEFRVPGRWHFVLEAVLAVLLGTGVQALMGKFDRPRSRSIFGIVVMALLLFDITRSPMPMMDTRLGYTAVPVATADDNRTLLDAPVGIKSGQGHAIGYYTRETTLRQLTHHRPILSVYVARLPNDVFARRKADQELDAWVAVQQGSIDDRSSTTIQELRWLDWPGFRERYNIGVVRISNDDYTSESLKILADRMAPWHWELVKNELIGK